MLFYYLRPYPVTEFRNGERGGSFNFFSIIYLMALFCFPLDSLLLFLAVSLRYGVFTCYTSLKTGAFLEDHVRCLAPIGNIY